MREISSEESQGNQCSTILSSKLPRRKRKRRRRNDLITNLTSSLPKNSQFFKFIKIQNLITSLIFPLVLWLGLENWILKTRRFCFWSLVGLNLTASICIIGLHLKSCSGNFPQEFPLFDQFVYFLPWSHELFHPSAPEGWFEGLAMCQKFFFE